MYDEYDSTRLRRDEREAVFFDVFLADFLDGVLAIVLRVRVPARGGGEREVEKRGVSGQSLDAAAAAAAGVCVASAAPRKGGPRARF